MKKLIPAIFLIAIMLLAYACSSSYFPTSYYEFKVYGTSDSIKVDYDGEYEPGQEPDSSSIDRYGNSIRYKNEFPLIYKVRKTDINWSEFLYITNISDTGIIYIERTVTEDNRDYVSFSIYELLPGDQFSGNN